MKDLEEPGADDVINTDRYKWDGRNIKVGFGKLGDSDWNNFSQFQFGNKQSSQHHECQFDPVDVDLLYPH